MKRVLFVLLAVGLLQLSGCGGLGPKLSEMEGDKTALIYGYLDMSDAPSYLNWVYFKQFRPVTDEAETGMRLTCLESGGCVFYREVPTNGAYQLTRFGGNTNSFFSSADYYNFYFPSHGKNETAVKTRKSGLYYIGAFKYVDVKTGFFEQGKFDLKAVKKSKKELLQALLPHAKGTQWEALINGSISRMK